MHTRSPRGLVGWCVGGRRDSRNRRASRRFAVMSRPARVGWYDGETFATALVALRDVSLCGVSALSEVPLPSGTVVWVALNDQADRAGVKAVVVDVKRTRRLLTFRTNPFLLRMRFGLGCPYTFFREAVGLSPAGPRRTSRSAAIHAAL